MSRSPILIVTLLVSLVLVACDDGETVITTTSLAPTTTAESDATTTTTAPESTGTTLRGQIVTEYQTVARLSTSNGEVLHIVIPEGGYTDIDLYNFVADLKSADPRLWGVEVFDHPGGPAALAVSEAQRTAEQAEVLRRHHLISLVAGDTVRYQGPFASFGETILGS